MEMGRGKGSSSLYNCCGPDFPPLLLCEGIKDEVIYVGYLAQCLGHGKSSRIGN